MGLSKTGDCRCRSALPIYLAITQNGGKNGGCAAKSALHFLKSKGFGGPPYVYLKAAPVPYLQDSPGNEKKIVALTKLFMGGAAALARPR